MNKKLGFIVVVLALAALTLVGGIYASSAASNVPADIKHEIVFSIPVGDKGIHYTSDGPDMLIWGPPAITVAPDGTFWIADTADNHLLHFNSEGVLLDKIAVGDFTIGVGDIEVTSKAIWALDMASIPPKVIQLSLKGKVQQHYDLQEGLYPEDGLTGIAIGNDGSVLIEQEDGITITQFISPDSVVGQTTLAGYIFRDGVFSSRPTPLASDDSSHRYIQAGNKRIGIEFATDLGGVRILDVGSDGSFWVTVEEVVFNPAVQADEKVYQYDASGKLAGMARIPLTEMYTPVAHGIAVGPDGNVYILVTKPDGAEVQRLTFSARLSPILTPSSSREEVEQPYAESAVQLACRSRTSMISVAAGYRNNSTYLNSYHINDPSGECPSRTKPRYLGSAGNYSSVPYAWGIGDTVAQFNSFMNGGNNGKFAGDYTDPNSGCGRGVDCSGLVSNAWNLGSHYGTCTLETVSTQLSSTANLRQGDIMNRCSPTPRHTIIFDSFNSDKSAMYGYEATTYGNYDRVMRLYRTFTSISNYLPRRYNNVCSESYLPIIERGPAPNPYP